MKYFFTAAIPGIARDRDSHIRPRPCGTASSQMVEAERAEDVLSDDALVRRSSRSEGVDIARRTVAKYRESLRIPSSVDRRRDKQVVGMR